MIEQMASGAGGERQQAHVRAHARAPFTGAVRYFEWDRARTAQALEISAGGLFLRTPAPLPEGQMLTLRVELPGTRSAFTVLARVVRTVRGGPLRDSGMGLEFLDISAGHRQLIEGYVAARVGAH
jgi:uncharacterized protein (TIGR02266 family)